MARPVKEIDYNQVKALAQLGAKTQEIADFFGVDADTITNRFSDALAEGKASMRLKIREYQMALAKKGNATMLIWLGKQYLGQTDDIPQEQREPFKFNYERPNKK